MIVLAGLLVLLCLYPSITASAGQSVTAAEDSAPMPQAAPVTKVVTETGEAVKAAGEIPVTAFSQPEARAAVFIELFSSQGCTFCPQADRLFADLLKQDDVIGIACHVDYFNVRNDDLARPFCTDRQKWYMQTLKTGPQYTPQMVVNGRYDVVGYKIDDVKETLEKARQERFFMLNIVPNPDANGSYDFVLPATELEEDTDMQIWLALYNKEQNLTITDGRNRGKSMQYVNIASGLHFLGSWDGRMETRQIKPDLKEGHGGFVIFIQDKNSGGIAALGRQKIQAASP